MTGPASEATAYPVLSDDQLARLRRYGTTRPVTAGQVLFSPADDRYDLVVVLSGEVAVSSESHGRSVEYARHGPGEFAGELNLLTGQRPFLTARAATEGEVLALTPAQLREVLARETAIADILLRALIARRRRRVSGAAPDAVIELIGTGSPGRHWPCVPSSTATRSPTTGWTSTSPGTPPISSAASAPPPMTCRW